MLDAARLLKQGLPTVAIVWDIFERAARAMAELQGVPGLSIVVVPQVTVGDTEAAQREKGAKAAQRIVAEWVSPG